MNQHCRSLCPLLFDPVSSPNCPLLSVLQVSPQGSRGDSPLLLAMKQDPPLWGVAVRIAGMLEVGGADIDARDSSLQDTPLVIAIKRGHAEMGKCYVTFI